jgi:hypothetical protein
MLAVSEAAQLMCALAQLAEFATVAKVHIETHAESPLLLCIMLTAALGSARFIHEK